MLKVSVELLLFDESFFSNLIRLLHILYRTLRGDGTASIQSLEKVVAVLLLAHITSSLRCKLCCTTRRKKKKKRIFFFTLFCARVCEEYNKKFHKVDNKKIYFGCLQ